LCWSCAVYWHRLLWTLPVSLLLLLLAAAPVSALTLLLCSAAATTSSAGCSSCCGCCGKGHTTARLRLLLLRRLQVWQEGWQLLWLQDEAGA
jgi:hypothetical protein